MSLTPSQIESIRRVGQSVLGSQVSTRLFGPRVSNALKGGKIDLLFETELMGDNKVQVICNIKGALMRTLGDRKIDFQLKVPCTPDAAIFEIARRTEVTFSAVHISRNMSKDSSGCARSEICWAT